MIFHCQVVFLYFLLQIVIFFSLYISATSNNLIVVFDSWSLHFLLPKEGKLHEKSNRSTLFVTCHLLPFMAVLKKLFKPSCIQFTGCLSGLEGGGDRGESTVRAGVGKIQPAGQNRPTGHFHPACGTSTPSQRIASCPALLPMFTAPNVLY